MLADMPMPEDVKEPLVGFLASGLQQFARVVHGPRPRREIADRMGYRSCRRYSSLHIGSKRQKNSRNGAESPRQREEKIHTREPLVFGGDSVAPPSEKERSPTVFRLAAVPAPLLIDHKFGPIKPYTHLLLLSDTIRHILAGTAARTMSQAFIHPLDTIKTRLQVNKRSAPVQLQTWKNRTKSRSLNIFLGRKHVVSVRNWLSAGPLDLYRGLSGAVLGTVPVAIIYFSTYEACKAFLEARDITGAAAHLSSASAGAALSATVRVPADTLKHRVQAYIIPDILQGAKNIIRTDGIRGLYQGMLPTLLRDVPELALQFGLYECLRHYLEEHKKVKKLQTWEHLVLGGVSGAAAASATMPLDVAKTALQCGSKEGMRLTLQSIVQEKGVQGLFAGMEPRVTQIALQGAMFFTLFEAWKAHLKQASHRLEHDRLMAPKLWKKRRGHVWKRQFVVQ